MRMKIRKDVKGKEEGQGLTTVSLTVLCKTHEKGSNQLRHELYFRADEFKYGSSNTEKGGVPSASH
jgi:hypothetical protein